MTTKFLSHPIKMQLHICRICSGPHKNVLCPILRWDLIKPSEFQAEIDGNEEAQINLYMDKKYSRGK